MKVCVDSSLVLSWLLPTPESQASSILYQKWEREGVEVLAPSSLTEEVISILREQVFRGRLTPSEGERAFSLFLSLGLELVDTQELWVHAWELVQKLNLPQVREAIYLALAEVSGCELWTADRGGLGVLGNDSGIRWAGEVFEKQYKGLDL
jgi:predicted nucleic acid-binding protein